MSLNSVNHITYLQLNSSYFFYNESNKFYIKSQSSSRKMKDSFKYITIMNGNEIIKKTAICSYKNEDYKNTALNFYNNYLEYKKRSFFKSTFYENKGKIKIIGRGWKITKYPYELLIKLGYSHPIFLTLDPYLNYKLKKKKKKYYVFYGVSYDKVNTLMSKFSLMRIPDIYTRKGIFQRKVVL